MANEPGEYTRCVAGRRGRFRFRRIDGDEAATILAALLSGPDGVLGRGVALVSAWRARVTDKAKVTIAGREYFLKRYNCAGWLYRFKNVFRASKALRCWQAVRVFRDRGVPTVQPLVFLEERQGGLLGCSYLVFPFLSGEADNLLELWPRLNENERTQCLTVLAQIIGSMHRQGVLHGDLNWRNILVRRTGGDFEFFLVDLDGSRLRKRLGRQVAFRDLAHFLRDLNRNGVPAWEQQRFLDRWRQWASDASRCGGGNRR